MRRAVEAAGIPSAIVDQALREALEGVDQAATVEDALDRGLHGHQGTIDERTAARLYRRLVAHGHDPQLVGRALSARRRAARDE